jgi:hypothetical protein
MVSFTSYDNKIKRLAVDSLRSRRFRLLVCGALHYMKILMTTAPNEEDSN